MDSFAVGTSAHTEPWQEQPRLPNGAQAFLEDLARRAATLSVAGHALLIECADPDLAFRLGHGTKTKPLCTVVDNRTIVVPAESEAAFRRAVKALGYPVLSRAGQ